MANSYDPHHAPNKENQCKVHIVHKDCSNEWRPTVHLTTQGLWKSHSQTDPDDAECQTDYKPPECTLLCGAFPQDSKDKNSGDRGRQLGYNLLDVDE